jgi:hypothetical protein
MISLQIRDSGSRHIILESGLETRVFCTPFRARYSVRAAAVPDPERPEDRLAMSIAAEIGHNFREGIPWIDYELDRIVAIAGPAGPQSDDMMYKITCLAFTEDWYERTGKKNSHIILKSIFTSATQYLSFI